MASHTNNPATASAGYLQQKSQPEIAKEIESCTKPSPALKEMKEKGLITCDRDKTYSLTKKGRSEKACSVFCRIFYDGYGQLLQIASK